MQKENGDYWNSGGASYFLDPWNNISDTKANQASQTWEVLTGSFSRWGGLNIETIKKTGITRDIWQNLVVFAYRDGLDKREKSYLKALANNFKITEEEVEMILSQQPEKIDIDSYQDKVAYLLLAIDLATQDEVISPIEKNEILEQAKNIHMDKVMLIFIENLLDSMTKAYESKKVLAIKNKEIKAQNEEIKAQQEKLSAQHTKLQEIHTELSASINYAKMIQEALLPQVDEMDALLSQYFVLYKPKDVVSGDYYRIKQQGDRILVTVADCTGHGVPGAFMSILGTNGLDDITKEDKRGELTPGEILDKLRIYIKESLRDEQELAGSKNGMDMALISLNKKERLLQYAGAYNPLYVVRKGEIIEFKATKSPVGAHIYEKSFVTNELKLEEGDMIYIFSDGYADQFGGEKNKKLNSKRMKEMFLTIANKSPKEQKQILQKFIENWRAEEEQTDDITVMGIKV